jgi:pyruvate/2-oxoglutarate/acetoin dehydrogenase E1 component
MVREAEKTAEELAGEGVDAEVLDPRTVSPLDAEAIIASVKKTGRCVVVHEAARTCGLGAEISALLMEEALLHLRAPVPRNRLRHGDAPAEGGALLPPRRAAHRAGGPTGDGVLN